MHRSNTEGDPVGKQGEQTKPTFEERLTAKLEQGEYTLVLVLALILWIAGFIGILSHTSQSREVLGLYSRVYFLAMALYSLGFVFWGLLIIPADSISWFKRGINFFQTRTLAAIAWFSVSIFLILSMFVWGR
jgi:hypothetical protein